MSLKRIVLYNTLVQFLGRFGISFLGFLTTLLIARNFGAAGYGSYAKAYTLVAFFYLFTDFGLNAVYIRRHKDNLAHFPLLTLARTFLFCVAVAAIFIFVGFTYGQVFKGGEVWLVLLFLLTILSFGYYTSLNALFQIKARYDLSVLAALIGGVIGLVVSYISIPFGLAAVTFGMVFGYLLTAVFAYFLAKKIAHFSFFKNHSITKKETVQLLKEAAPLGIMLFVNTMYFRSDIFILSYLKGNAAVGVYQLAYKFFEVPLTFATFYANATFPHYVKMYEHEHGRFWQIFIRSGLMLMGAALVFTTGAYILAPLLQFIKQDFAASVEPLRILSFSYVIFFLTSPLSWLLFIQKREKYLVAVYLCGTVFSVFLNFYFIPRFSYIASAWLTVASEGFILLGMLVILFVFRSQKEHA